MFRMLFDYPGRFFRNAGNWSPSITESSLMSKLQQCRTFNCDVLGGYMWNGMATIRTARTQGPNGMATIRTARIQGPGMLIQPKMSIRHLMNCTWGTAQFCTISGLLNLWKGDASGLWRTEHTRGGGGGLDVHEGKLLPEKEQTIWWTKSFGPLIPWCVKVTCPHVMRELS
jgi:hypothetical protein